MFLLLLLFRTLISQDITAVDTFFLGSRSLAQTSGGIDIVFVLDSSSSVDDDVFSSQLDILATAVENSFPIHDARIGMVMYATEPQTKIPVQAGPLHDWATLVRAQSRIPAGATYTEAAMIHAYNEVWDNGLIDSSRRQITLLLTDGNTDRGQDVCDVWPTYQAAGIEILTVLYPDDPSTLDLTPFDCEGEGYKYIITAPGVYDFNGYLSSVYTPYDGQYDKHPSIDFADYPTYYSPTGNERFYWDGVYNGDKRLWTAEGLDEKMIDTERTVVDFIQDGRTWTMGGDTFENIPAWYGGFVKVEMIGRQPSQTHIASEISSYDTYQDMDTAQFEYFFPQGDSFTVAVDYTDDDMLYTCFTAPRGVTCGSFSECADSEYTGQVSTVNFDLTVDCKVWYDVPVRYSNSGPWGDGVVITIGSHVPGFMATTLPRFVRNGETTVRLPTGQYSVELLSSPVGHQCTLTMYTTDDAVDLTGQVTSDSYVALDCTIDPTVSPSSNPSRTPSRTPTRAPSNAPTPFPSAVPTISPSKSPTRTPSRTPSGTPSEVPSNSPSVKPSRNPTVNPTNSPSDAPIFMPTRNPSFTQPTTSPEMSIPSTSPTDNPSTTPSFTSPSTSPTTDQPSNRPTVSPSDQPTLNPSTDEPSKRPTNTPRPSLSPTISSPTENPSVSPSKDPSKNPTHGPSVAPTLQPSDLPSTTPSSDPTGDCEHFNMGFNVCNPYQNGDMLFVMDSSSSMDEEQFETMKSIVASEIETYTTDESFSQVALMTFSSQVDQIFGFQGYDQVEAMKDSVNDLTLAGGSSVLSQAITSARLTVWPTGRPDADPREKVTIILTDGTFSTGENPCNQASSYAALDITIWVIDMNDAGSKMNTNDKTTFPGCFMGLSNTVQVSHVTDVLNDAISVQLQRLSVFKTSTENCASSSQATPYDGAYSRDYRRLVNGVCTYWHTENYVAYINSEGHWSFARSLDAEESEILVSSYTTFQIYPETGNDWRIGVGTADERTIFSLPIECTKIKTPTRSPSIAPIVKPTVGPTDLPTTTPSDVPSVDPTQSPSLTPAVATFTFLETQDCDSADGLQLADIYFFDSEGNAIETDLMTVTSTGTSYNGWEGPENLIDHDRVRKYLDFDMALCQQQITVEIILPGRRATQYSFVSAKDARSYPERNPGLWRLDFCEGLTSCVSMHHKDATPPFNFMETRRYPIEPSFQLFANVLNIPTDDTEKVTVDAGYGEDSAVATPTDSLVSLGNWYITGDDFTLSGDDCYVREPTGTIGTADFTVDVNCQYCPSFMYGYCTCDFEGLNMDIIVVMDTMSDYNFERYTDNIADSFDENLPDNARIAFMSNQLGGDGKVHDVIINLDDTRTNEEKIQVIRDHLGEGENGADKTFGSDTQQRRNLQTTSDCSNFIVGAPVCRATDFNLVLDASASISQSEFEIYVSSLKKAMETFPQDSRLGLMQFSTEPVIHFNLDNDLTYAQMTEEFDAVYEQGGNTGFERALETNLNDMWPDGGNSYSKQLIIVLQDTPSIGQDACDMAQAFADANINILGISVGPTDTSQYISCLKVEGAENSVTVVRYESFELAEEALSSIFQQKSEWNNLCTAVVSDETAFDGGWAVTGETRDGKSVWADNDGSLLYWVDSLLQWEARNDDGVYMRSLGSTDGEHPDNFLSWQGYDAGDNPTIVYNDITVVCSTTDIPTWSPTVAPTNPTSSPTRRWTYLQEALNRAEDEIRAPNEVEGRNTYVIVFSDGFLDGEDNYDIKSPCIDSTPVGSITSLAGNAHQIDVRAVGDVPFGTNSLACLDGNMHPPNSWWMHDFWQTIENSCEDKSESPFNSFYEETGAVNGKPQFTSDREGYTITWDGETWVFEDPSDPSLTSHVVTNPGTLDMPDPNTNDGDGLGLSLLNFNTVEGYYQQVVCCQDERIITTFQPSRSPDTSIPTGSPSVIPSDAPTLSPTHPTFYPTTMPTISKPTVVPTTSPSRNPTFTSPSGKPSIAPSEFPTTDTPSVKPTGTPSSTPTVSAPSRSPTDCEICDDSTTPTCELGCQNCQVTPRACDYCAFATCLDTCTLCDPNFRPTCPPTPWGSECRYCTQIPRTCDECQYAICEDTAPPTSGPTMSPEISDPSVSPSTDEPSQVPSDCPSTMPSKGPSLSPSNSQPSTNPSFGPSGSPTTDEPSTSPSTTPTVSPSYSPSELPTSSVPSAVPTKSPTTSPSFTQPTTFPQYSYPSTSPSSNPSKMPTSSIPTGNPTTEEPSVTPTQNPTVSPATVTFTFTQTQDCNTDGIQFSDIYFYDAEGNVVDFEVTSYDSSNFNSWEGPNNINDQHFKTKWLDFNLANCEGTASVTLEVPGQTIVNYAFQTALDAQDYPERNPGLWNVEWCDPSQDCINWTHKNTEILDKSQLTRTYPVEESYSIYLDVKDVSDPVTTYNGNADELTTDADGLYLFGNWFITGEHFDLSNKDCYLTGGSAQMGTEDVTVLVECDLAQFCPSFQLGYCPCDMVDENLDLIFVLDTMSVMNYEAVVADIENTVQSRFPRGARIAFMTAAFEHVHEVYINFDQDLNTDEIVAAIGEIVISERRALEAKYSRRELQEDNCNSFIVGEPVCQSTDHILILDSSASVPEGDFRYYTEALQVAVGNFPQESRLGLIQFSTEPRMSFNINDGTTRSEMTQALDQLDAPVGSTDLQRAIDYTIDNMWPTVSSSSNKKMMILILQEEATEGQGVCDTDYPARLSGMGINILAIGVGSDTDALEKELNCFNTGSEDPKVEVRVHNTFQDAYDDISNIFNLFCVYEEGPESPYDTGFTLVPGSVEANNGKGVWRSAQNYEVRYNEAINKWYFTDPSGGLADMVDHNSRSRSTPVSSKFNYLAETGTITYDPVILYCKDTVIPTRYPTMAPTNPTFAPSRRFTHLREALDKIYDDVMTPYPSTDRRPHMVVYTDGEAIEDESPCVSGSAATTKIQNLIDGYDIDVVALSDTGVVTDSISCLGVISRFGNPWTGDTLFDDIEGTCDHSSVSIYNGFYSVSTEVENGRPVFYSTTGVKAAFDGVWTFGSNAGETQSEIAFSRYSIPTNGSSYTIGGATYIDQIVCCLETEPIVPAFAQAEETGYVEVLVDYDSTITSEQDLENYLTECSKFFQDAGYDVQCAAVTPGSVRITLVGKDKATVEEAVEWFENQETVQFDSFDEAEVNPNCEQCDAPTCEAGCLYCITTPNTCRECGTATCLPCESPSIPLDEQCPSTLTVQEQIECLKERLDYDKKIAATCAQLQQSSQDTCEAAISSIDSALSTCR